MKTKENLLAIVAGLATVIVISFARIILDTWADCLVDIFMTPTVTVTEAMAMTTAGTLALVLLVVSMGYDIWCKSHPIPLACGGYIPR